MKRILNISLLLILAIAVQILPTRVCIGGIVFGNSGLNGGFRWDAAPRTIGGFERSLNGGLRFSLQGGSYQAYRDQFSWAGTAPSVAEFQTIVETAFNTWSSVDPVSGLTSDLRFVADFNTAVDPTVNSGIRFGAEIDLFATNLGDSGTRGFTFFNAVGGTVQLTSGTTGYAAAPISGSDITINSNPGAIYTVDLFRRLLAHEIGHAIGFGDVEGDINPSNFIDDNYDGSTSAAALATLTNSWAGLVNPLNPSLSSLNIYNVPAADPGITTLGVDILMESRGLGIGPNNPLSSLVPMSNDDYGIRQFLYPSLTTVPESSVSGLLVLAIVAGVWRRQKPVR